MKEEEFKEKFCRNCGYSKCKGPTSKHFADCKFQTQYCNYKVTIEEGLDVSKEQAIKNWNKILHIMNSSGYSFIDVEVDEMLVSMAGTFIDFGVKYNVYECFVTYCDDYECHFYWIENENSSYIFKLCSIDRHENEYRYFRYSSIGDYLREYQDTDSDNMIL